MDYKFLDKVVDQIVSETTIDYDRKVIGTPLHFIPFDFFHPSFTSSIYPLIFSKHCRGVYGLNDDEIDRLKFLEGKHQTNILYTTHRSLLEKCARTYLPHLYHHPLVS